MIDSIEQERQRLMEEYRQADAPEQAVVKLLAVNWSPLGKAQIANVLRKVVGPTLVKEIDYNGLLRLKLLHPVKDWNGQRLGCNPLVVEQVARDLVLEGTFNVYVDLAHLAAPLQKGYLRDSLNEFVFRNEEELIREVRLGMYWRDEAYIASLYRMLEKHRYAYLSGGQRQWPEAASIYARVCSNPFDAEWFQGLPPGISQKALPAMLALLAADWRCDGQASGLLLGACKSADAPLGWHPMATLLAVYRGDWQDALALMLPRDAGQAMDIGTHGLLVWLQGDVDGAIKLFREGLTLLRRETGNKKAIFPGPLGLFFVMALHQRNAIGDMEEAQKLILGVDETDDFALAYRFFGHVAFLERNDKGLLEQLHALLDQSLSGGNMKPWVFWVGMMILYRYQTVTALAKYLPLMESCRKRAQTFGFAWLAAEMSGLLVGVAPDRTDARKEAAAFESRTGCKLLVNRIRREEPWERALKAISNTVARPKESKEKAIVETRLAWYVFPYNYSPTGYSVEIREQGRNAKGGWNKGKLVSVKRLRENAGEIVGMAEQDVRVASHISVDRYTSAHFLGERGWLALAGHPHVFWRDSGAPLELAVAEPELRVKKKAKTGQVRIEFWPAVSEGQKVAIAKDGLTRLQIIEIKPEHHRLADIVGDGLEAPLAAQERILASLSSVSSLVTIHSDIGGAELATAESVEADPRPRIQLIPEGEGLRIALLVRPFGEQGAYYAPGSGGAASSPKSAASACKPCAT